MCSYFGFVRFSFISRVRPSISVLIFGVKSVSPSYATHKICFSKFASEIRESVPVNICKSVFLKKFFKIVTMIFGRLQTYTNVQTLFVELICVDFKSMNSMLRDVIYCLNYNNRTMSSARVRRTVSYE